MICVRRFEVTRVECQPSGYMCTRDNRFILKFPNDAVPYDKSLNAKFWKKWLERYKDKTGKPLARKSKFGNNYAYNVYYWGITKELQAIWKRDRGHHINVFPAYKKSGEKLPVHIYGVLD